MSENSRKHKTEVTILLAAFNGENYLSCQIDSIVGQTYKNWRLLVSDDGSTDGTLKILELYQRKYTDKIKILQNHISFGSARDNFFYLINNADSDYIMLCDQDDVWLPDKIEITLKRMKRIEAASAKNCPTLVFTDLAVVDSQLNLIEESFIKYSNLNGLRTALNQLLVQNVVTGCTILFNKHLSEISQKYKSSNEILMHDWWLALVASAFGKIEYIDVPTIKYRQHETNTVGAKKIKSINYALKKALTMNDIKKSLFDTMHQAEQLYLSYEDKLTKQDYNLVKGYAALYKKNKIKRLLFYFKHKTFKNGLLRKIGQIVLG